MQGLKHTPELLASRQIGVGREGEVITRSTTWDQLNMDSLEVYQLAMDAEERHDITIVDDDIAYMKTLGDLEDIIEKKLTENRRG